KDIGQTTLIAFTTGCSYRRRLEAWLGSAQVVANRIMEFGSYHAIAACVAAGGGIAVRPRSVLRGVAAGKNVGGRPVPGAVAKAATHVIWRRGEKSAALEALLATIRRMAR